VRTNSDNYRDEPPTDRWPPNIEEWPLDQQITQVTMRMTRKGLIASLLPHAGLSPDDYELRDDTKLTKKELSAIYLTLEGKNDGSQ
jgi:hypothetical protein